MSMASDISTISSSLNAIKNAIIDKGVTPSGNITTYADAISQIGNSVACSFKIPDDVTTISTGYLFDEQFDNFPYALNVDFNNLETISGDYAFAAFLYDEEHGGRVSIKNLKTVSGTCALQNAFYVNYDTTAEPYYADLDLSKLETISGSQGLSGTFVGCHLVNTTVNFTSLSDISGSSCLQLCFAMSNVSEINFSALASQSFGSATNQFGIMLMGVEDCTVHFPSNLQSVIGSWQDVQEGFGGTNTTVLFDLPATS